MAYEPKTWACGDTITADDLNHIEQGVAEAGGILTVNVTAYAPECGDAYQVTADKTQAEIVQANEDGKLIVFKTEFWCDSVPHNILSAFAKVSENGGGGRMPTFAAYYLTGSSSYSYTILSESGEWSFH